VITIDNEEVQLEIQDTSALDHNFALSLAAEEDGAMRKGDGFIVAYGIDDQGSFDAVENLHGRLQMLAESENPPVVICGNHCQPEDERVVSKVQGEELAAKLGCPFFETSLWEYTNVENVFVASVREGRKYEMRWVEENAAKKRKKGKKRKCHPQ
jgi:GTPase SAR1 family protein